jgi:CBS domain-containing protein/sporulation protein YlmC with PRC-barrel domain
MPKSQTHTCAPLILSVDFPKFDSMGAENINFIFFSEMLNLRVLLAAGQTIGKITDLAATPTQVYPKITGLIVSRNGKRQPTYIPWNSVRRITSRKTIEVDHIPSLEQGIATAGENDILLRRTFLDKQIISTSGYKLVRVNDLHLLIDSTDKENSNLWLVHIDIGFKGLLRRLGWLYPTNALFKWLVGRDIKEKFVSWKHVQPTSTTSVKGSLHLKTDVSKLGEVHPADLADIIEDLGTDERVMLIESLDPILAAQTFQEMPLRLREQLAETIDGQKLAIIIDEMQLDEAVDLMDELSPEQRSGLLKLLPQEKSLEIRDLSKLSSLGVGSIMNTNFLVATPDQTVDQVLEMIRNECKRAEVLYYVYILDGAEHLHATATLRQLLSAEHGTLLKEIMNEHVISVEVDTSLKRVARLFHKYNFEAIPVVDEERRMVGLVTLRDTLERVFPEIREEAKG